LARKILESAITGTESFAGGAPVAVVSEAAAGDEVMDVGMIEELAGPGMQYSDHAQAGADEPWI